MCIVLIEYLNYLFPYYYYTIVFLKEHFFGRYQQLCSMIIQKSSVFVSLSFAIALVLPSTDNSWSTKYEKVHIPKGTSLSFLKLIYSSISPFHKITTVINWCKKAIFFCYYFLLSRQWYICFPVKKHQLHGLFDTMKSSEDCFLYL